MTLSRRQKRQAVGQQNVLSKLSTISRMSILSGWIDICWLGQQEKQKKRKMPELPEVEVIRRGLLKHLRGRTVTAITWSGKSLRTTMPYKQLTRCIQGETILTVERRAKYLLLRMESGSVLIIHLGMTGKTGIFPVATPKAKHDHLCLSLDGDMEMRLNDTRRFGSVAVWSKETATKDEQNFSESQGIEPFSQDFNGEQLARMAIKKNTAIKTFLMDSRRIAGVGNIYANETLFRAGILPNTPAGKLSLEEWQKITDICRNILSDAIEAGGSTVSDFINSSGEPGYFQLQLQAYGKENSPCQLCGTTIRKTMIGGRASFFCPACQRLPEDR